MEDVSSVQLVTIEPWQFFGAMAAAVVALWTMIWWYAREAQLREVRMTKDNLAREQAMGKVIKGLEEYNRTTLQGVIESTLNALNGHTNALSENTRVTNELRLEIHTLRLEAKDRRQRTGDSGIHP